MSDKYNLTAPCPGCPFHTTSKEAIRHLSADRLIEIVGRLGMIDEDELLANEDLVICDIDELIEVHTGGD